MLGFSFTEIILLAIIALVVIGPKQLPEVARNLGRFLNELKRTSNAFTREFRENMDNAKIDPIRFDEPKFHEPKPAEPTTTTTAASPAMASAEPHVVTPASIHGHDAMKVGSSETTEPLTNITTATASLPAAAAVPEVTSATLPPASAPTVPPQVYTQETHTRSSYYRPDTPAAATTSQATTPQFLLEPSHTDIAENKASKKETDSHD